MTLRQRLGADVQRLYDQLDDMLDSEDAVIVLVDARRITHYARGFGLSACHHELLAVQLEGAIRGLTRVDSVHDSHQAVAQQPSSRAA